MFLRMLRWLGKNISTLLLAFIFAFVVWVSAIIAADPNEVQVYPRSLSISMVGLDSQLMLVNELTTQVHVTLRAPKSIWSKLNANPDLVKVWVDLAGLEPGEYTLPIKVQVGATPNQVIKVEPAEISLSLEQLITKTFPVEMSVNGEPALGYRKGAVTTSPPEVQISGPASQVNKISYAIARLDIEGVNETIRKTIAVEPVGTNGESISGVDISPATILASQQISLLGGYRNVVVKVTTNGQVADGYWLTNVSVTPPNVTVFSTDPQLVNELPGYVETKPVDLTGLSDDVDIRATLELPKDVTLAGEESVLIRLSIAALEGSLPISLPVQVIGLSPEYSAQISPEAVDVLISGPLPLINSLTSSSIRVSVDLTGMKPGSYQVIPVVDLLPNQLKVASIMPENVEVTITLAFPVTPTSIKHPTVTPTPVPPTPTKTPYELEP
jgi:YbbR domain-containing protein